MKRKNTKLLLKLLTIVLILTMLPFGALIASGQNGDGEPLTMSDTEYSHMNNDPISRAEFVNMLYQAAGEPSVEGDSPFLDVPPGAQHVVSITWAAQNGVVAGVGGSRFDPESNVTREQAATILLNFARSAGYGPIGAWAFFMDYADVEKISEWAFEGVMYSMIHAFIDDKEGHMFDPRGVVTRTEAGIWLDRLFEVVNENSRDQTGSSTGALSHEYFAGKDIAVITGVLTYDTTEKIGGNPVEYSDSASAVEAVRSGSVAGFMHALSLVQVMADEYGDEFTVVPIPYDIFSAQIGGFSHDQAIIDRFNAFFADIEADGTLDEVRDRWFGSGRDLSAPMPTIDNKGENGAISVAVCSDSAPYVFIGADGSYSGYSIELALRFGAYEGKTVEFSDMDFADLITYVSGQKADFGIANMAITEERAESVLFTAPIFDERHGVLVLNQSVEGALGGEPTSPGNAVYPDRDLEIAVSSEMYCVVFGELMQAFLMEYDQRAVLMVMDYQIFAQMLESLACDAVICDIDIINELNEALGETVYTAIPCVENNGITLCIAVHKDATGLVDILEKALQDLKDAGAVDIVLEYWNN